MTCLIFCLKDVKCLLVRSSWSVGLASEELVFYMFVLLHNPFCGTLIGLCIVMRFALYSDI